MREIIQLEICPGCECLEPYIGHNSWGLTQGRETPLDGCRAMWTTRRSVGRPDSPSRSMCSGIPFSSGPSPPASCLHYSPTSKQLKTLPRGNFWSDSGPLRVEVLKNFLKAYSAILFGLHKIEFPISSFIGTKNNSSRAS